MLLQHHQDVVAGDFHGAWNLTSPRYQQEKLRDVGGYNTWVSHQQTLQSYLQPNGMQVSIVSWDPKSQVATVRVNGMRWTAPRATCQYWQGITWVANVNGSWYYEPGYSISPQRRAQWEPRQSELLGGGCGT